MPYVETRPDAIYVTLFISSLAPVVTLPKNIFSAIRPPRATLIISTRASRVYKLSSSGRY